MRPPTLTRWEKILGSWADGPSSVGQWGPVEPADWLQSPALRLPVTFPWAGHSPPDLPFRTWKVGTTSTAGSLWGPVSNMWGLSRYWAHERRVRTAVPEVLSPTPEPCWWEKSLNRDIRHTLHSETPDLYSAARLWFRSQVHLARVLIPPPTSCTPSGTCLGCSPQAFAGVCLPVISGFPGLNTLRSTSSPWCLLSLISFLAHISLWHTCFLTWACLSPWKGSSSRVSSGVSHITCCVPSPWNKSAFLKWTIQSFQYIHSHATTTTEF